MNFIVVKGTYRVVGSSPDADSVKFKADSSAVWSRLNTQYPKQFAEALAAEGGVIMLRLHGVDALETHYSVPRPPLPPELKVLPTALKEPPRTTYKQPAALGVLATDKFLALLGFSSVKWQRTPRGSYISEVRTSATGTPIKKEGDDALPGFVVTGDTDQNGRPLSWAFTGSTPLADGATISAEDLAAMADRSANYQLIRTGMIYPLYLMSLAGVLRRKLDAAVQEAQLAASRLPADAPPSNIWQMDRSTKGVTIPTLKAITDEQVIYPDLFRRIIRHVSNLETAAYWEAIRSSATAIPPISSLALNKMFVGANPYVFVISGQDFLRLTDVIEVNGDTVRMKRSPHDLVFLS